MTEQPTAPAAPDYTKLTWAQVKATSFPTNVQHISCVRCGTIFNYDRSRVRPLCNSERMCDRRLATGLENLNKRVIATRNEDGGIVRRRRTVADTLAEIAKLQPQPEPEPEQPAAEPQPEPQPQPAAEPESAQEPAPQPAADANPKPARKPARKSA